MNTNNIIPIFFATDDNYAPLLHVAIQSIVSQASKLYNYNIHVLCENLNDKNKKLFDHYKSDNVNIIINDLTDSIGDKAEKMHTRDYYSRTTYFRVYIPNMFPQYKKALYLDCDICLNGDISELYNTDLGDNFVGAITCETCDTSPIFTAYVDSFLGLKLPHYFNAGILVMNLDAMRKINLEDRFFDLMSKVTFELIQDQDYLNVLCEGRVKFLPIIWNKTARPVITHNLDEIKLVHFNLSYRPWRYDNVVFEELWWKHAKNTPIYDKLVEMKNNFTEADAKKDQDMMENLVRLAVRDTNRPDTYKNRLASGEIVLMK